MPDSAIESGELLALLATETVPVAAPAADGVKVVVRVADWPGFTITPLIPVALKPAPDTVTLEMVTAEFPAFVRVTVFVPLAETLTLPKFKDDTLEFRMREEAVTVRVAVLLVTLPALLDTVTVNCAVAVCAGVVYVEPVAPLMATPPLLHWYESGPVPVAATLNVAVFPEEIVWLAGCVVIDGATTALATLSTAAELVAVPALLLTETVNWALLSAVVSAGVVYVDALAPLTAAPFFFHW